MAKAKFVKMVRDIAKNFNKDQEIIQLAEQLEERIKLYQEDDSGPNSTKVEAYPLPSSILNGGKVFALFSDGACRGNPGPGAWGAIGQSGSGEVLFESSGIECSTTNNRMELEGAISSLSNILNYLEEMSLSATDPNVFIHLFSDSKYVIDGLDKWVHGWKLRGWKKADNKVPENIELWKNLDQLVGKFRNIRYHWVKGHNGHPQNERCDQLANKALDESGF